MTKRPNRRVDAKKGSEMGSAIAAAALGAFMTGAGPGASPAQAAIPPEDGVRAARPYRIPLGSVTEALNSIADDNGLHVLYDAAITRGRVTPGLSGEFTLREALDHVLAGTGLGYRFTNNGYAVSIVLAQADNGVRNDAGAEPLPPIDIGAERTQSSPPTKPGAADKFGNLPPDAYVTPNASTATKIDLPLRDVPQSVKVITPQLIEDQGPQLRVYDLANQVSGVIGNPIGGSVGAANSPNFQIRGFANGGVVLQDGMYRYYGESAIDLADIDHVEFAKGPSSTLYGDSSGSYGGTVNFISKRPTDKFFVHVGEGVGSFGFHRTTIDFNMPLRDDKSLLFRLNAALEQKNGTQHQEYHDAFFVSPALTLFLDNGDKLDFHGQYGVTHERSSAGSPIYPIFQLLPREEFIGDLRFNAVHPIANATLKYEHKFNESWNVTATLDYNYTREYLPVATYSFDGASQLNLGQFNYYFTPHEDTLQGQIDLRGKFDTGAIKHNTVFGLYRRQFWRVLNTNLDFPPTPESINIFYPIYPNTQCFFNERGCALADGGGYYASSLNWAINAIYGQDIVEITDQFKLLLGGRYDSAKTWSVIRNPENIFGLGYYLDSKQNYEYFSPHLGGVYQPFKETSLFAAWGKSFTPSSANLSFGHPAPPEYSEQLDIGVKQELFDGRVQAGATAFDISRTNVLVPNPVNPLSSLLIGTYHSHGLEFDLTGEVLPNLRVNAALTFMHGQAGRDTNTPTNEGSELTFSPRRFYNFSAIYAFKEGPLNGLDVGAKFYYAAKTPALFPNNPQSNLNNILNGGNFSNQYPFTIAPIYDFGLFASYKVNDQIKIQVNANNLFDRSNWKSNGFGAMQRGEPRSIFANITYKFE